MQELTAKGISAELARNIIEELRAAEMQEGSEMAEDRDAALLVARKMLRGQWEDDKAADDKFLARVGRRLVGLGYDGSVIYDILGKLRQDERDRREAER